MDLSEIRQIIEMMITNDLSLFHMERDAPAPFPAAAPATAPAAAAAPAEPPAATGAVIPSPMVGTFYRSPGPGEKMFVNVGDSVEEGTTVCIIEAMKVMNEIKAEKRGVITRIIAEDASPVQYETPLFEIRPA